MLKREINKTDWKEIEPTYIKGGVQYYLLHVNNIEKEDVISCVEEIYDHQPTEEDKTQLYADYLSLTQLVTKTNAEKYAATSEVKTFSIKQGEVEASGWFDDEKRTSIKNSVSVEKASGRTTSKIFVSGIEFMLSCDEALSMIDSLELYAKDCFVATETHKATIDSISTINEAESYDYTSGYPEKRSFIF